MKTSDDRKGGLEEVAPLYEPLLRVGQVAALLGISNKKRVYELDIPAVPLGPHQLRWLAADVQAWINSRRTRR